MIKVVGFDLDNTLYNQTDFEFEIFLKISKLVSLKYFIDQDNYFTNLKNQYNKNEKEFVFDKAFLSLNLDLPNDWDSFIKNEVLPLYRQYKPKKLHLFNEVLFNLEGIRKKYKLCLITNGNFLVQNNKIDALGVKGLFDLILISDFYNPPRRKPDTYMFLESLKFFDIKSYEMIYVGDDLFYDKSCESAGIKFVNICDFDWNKME